jgi:hypothetical protein
MDYKIPRVPLIPGRNLRASPLAGHSVREKGPKNLITTRKYDFLRFAQDDKMAWRRALNEPSNQWHRYLACADAG